MWREEKLRQCVNKNLLTINIILGVVLGLITGILIRTATYVPEHQAHYMSFVGGVLIRMLKNVAMPLIFTSIICAIGSMSLKVAKTLGWQIVFLILITKIAVIVIALVLVTSINPGGKGKKNASSSPSGGASTIPDIFLDMTRNLVPHNMVSMFVKQYHTKLTPPDKNTSDYYAWGVEDRYLDKFNILGAISIAIVLGTCLSILGPRKHHFLTFAASVYVVSMELTKWILWTAGPFLFFFILAEIVVIENFDLYLSTWGLLVATFVLSCILVSFIFYPLLLFLAGQTNPFTFYASLAGVYATALGTASSMGTLPLLIKELEKMGMEPRKWH